MRGRRSSGRPAVRQRPAPGNHPEKARPFVCLLLSLQCVAAKLGNTAAVCRKAYVHPAVLETYARDLKVPKADDERLVLRFLEAVERKEKIPLEKLLKKSVTYSGGKARAL